MCYNINPSVKRICVNTANNKNIMIETLLKLTGLILQVIGLSTVAVVVVALFLAKTDAYGRDDDD